jgi:hypothetical protein
MRVGGTNCYMTGKYLKQNERSDEK